MVAPSDVDQVVLAITLDREEIPVGILEPGDFAAASAGGDPPLVGPVIEAALEHAFVLLEGHAVRGQLVDHLLDVVDVPARQGRGRPTGVIRSWVDLQRLVTARLVDLASVSPGP